MWLREEAKRSRVMGSVSSSLLSRSEKEWEVGEEERGKEEEKEGRRNSEGKQLDFWRLMQ